MDFQYALTALKEGQWVSREGWNGKGQALRMVKGVQTEISGDMQTLVPFIVIHTSDNKYVPWLASQTDLLAEDWFMLS